MKSILDNRPELAKEVNKVAEVAGYLWQKGWAERNGGNIPHRTDCPVSQQKVHGKRCGNQPVMEYDS